MCMIFVPEKKKKCVEDQQNTRISALYLREGYFQADQIVIDGIHKYVLKNFKNYGSFNTPCYDKADKQS